MTPHVPAKRVIPRAAWVVAVIVYLLALIVLAIAMTEAHGTHEDVRVLVPVIVPALLAGYVLLVGYVNGDARRRGMRHVLWTWLAILIPNGIGPILYFILREPLQSYCTACGKATQRGFAYCPSCGASVAPACSQCHRVLQPGWSHCAYCGARL